MGCVALLWMLVVDARESGRLGLRRDLLDMAVVDLDRLGAGAI